MLAGVGAGLCTVETARTMLRIERQFTPELPDEARLAHLARWDEAVGRVKTRS
jgi:glycerol kinase